MSLGSEKSALLTEFSLFGRQGSCAGGRGYSANALTSVRTETTPHLAIPAKRQTLNSTRASLDSRKR